jgi:hypothetical protein
MTEEALEFPQLPRLVGGADVRYAVNSTGATLGVDTTVLLDPVIAVIYGQAGLIVGRHAGRHALHAHPSLRSTFAAVCFFRPVLLRRGASTCPR